MTAREDDARELSELQPQRDLVREMVRTMLHEVMEEEVTRYLGAEPHERTEERRGYRNGRKGRSWKTRVGELELRVPQVRDTEPYRPSFIARWERSERALLTACAEMYFQGVSTRKVAAVLEELGGFSLSATTVSKVAAELDEQIEAFRSRPLDHCRWPYLVVDARYEKVRRAKRIVSVAVLLVSGVNDRGRREILTWRIGDSESEDTWRELFVELKRRGLSGVELVTADAHKGIRAAMDREFPGVPWQRCRVHFMREMLGKVSHKHRAALASDLSAAFRCESRAMALEAAREVAERWAERSPRVASAIEDGFEQCLTVCELPTAHQRRLHSTNMLERVMRTLKQRTRVVGIFPNEASLDRLVGAVLIEMDETWHCEPMRYLVMEQDY
jgi:transposase-like protein